jgi:hypothetical protein
MAYMDVYDYSGMSHFIEEFRNPFVDRPFITEMEENYRMLWQFKDSVDRWTLDVSHYKGYAYLLHKEPKSPTFLPLNVSEKVMLVEQLHGEYIVIGIQVVNKAGSELAHIHSVIVKSGEGSVCFDVKGMLENLSSSVQQELADLLRSKYSSWTSTDVESENYQLNQILQLLTRYLARPAPTSTAAPRGGVPPLDASVATASGSGAQASNSRSTTCPTGCASLRVWSRVTTEEPEPAQKRQCSSTSAGSSGSSLTHVDNQGRGDAEEVPEYEKFTAAQKEFWDTCTSSFLFGMQTFSVHISQCETTKDEYIIRKMEIEIVKSVKAELLQMGDINQWQKICLTPINEQRWLLLAFLL